MLAKRALQLLGVAHDDDETVWWATDSGTQLATHLREFSGGRPPSEVVVVVERAGRRQRLGTVRLTDLLADAAGSDLSGCDLSHLDLDGADLEAAYAPGCDFWGTSLRGANLAGAILARCQFGKADVSFASFDDADCRETDFEGANTFGATFARCDMRGAIDGPHLLL